MKGTRKRGGKKGDVLSSCWRFPNPRGPDYLGAWRLAQATQLTGIFSRGIEENVGQKEKRERRFVLFLGGIYTYKTQNNFQST